MTAVMKGMRKSFVYVSVAVMSTVASVVGVGIATAQQPTGGSDFGLYVTPSPLISTIKPGQTTDLELKITNTGRAVEKLYIQPREFKVDRKTGEVTLLDTIPSDIKDWIKFSASTFSVDPGEVYTQKIKIALPAQTGFSYSFVLFISRTSGTETTVNSGAALSGSVAIFTLLNVDRPGATRQFEVLDFKTTQSVYEYLPTDFQTTFRNTGNTIAKPSGNIFIQRGANDKDPISVLQVNPSKGYMLPDTPRTMTATWGEGFPAYVTSTGADGQQKQDLVWDWSKIMDFRMGLYTAKLVAVYNDGQRDIPIERVVQFWVIPWRILLVVFVFVLVFVAGIWAILRKGGRLLRKKGSKRKDEAEQ